MSKKYLRLSVLLIICSIFLSACTFPWQKKTAVVNDLNQDSVTPTSENTQISTATVFTKQLKKFFKIDDLKTFLKEHSSANNFSASNSTFLASSSPLANYRADFKDGSAPDIIKVNSDYIYSLVRNDLVIVRSKPSSEAKITGRISFESRPQNILVSGNSLLVYGVNDKITNQTWFKNFRRQNTYTYLKVYDISDPTNPKLVRDLNFEGFYNSARLVGDYVYFLTDTPGVYIDGEPLLPKIADSNGVLNQICNTDSSHCFAPEVYYFDINYNSFYFENVSILNLKDNSEAISGQVYLLNDNQETYLSPSNLFLTYSEGLDEYGLEQLAKREIVFPKLSTIEQEKITKIEAVPDYILNNNEKKLKTGTIIDNYLSSLSADDLKLVQSNIDDGTKQKIAAYNNVSGKTSIYRFALSNKIAYEAIGEVNGQLIDSFSMDENGDYFRIATIVNTSAPTDSSQNGDFYSNLYILNKELKTVGSLENLATTDLINAARFVGNRAYLSTVKTDNPLYVIGLNDPTKLAVLGAVKVPGNTNHLFPFDPNGNQLISFGRDLETSTSTRLTVDKGIKLSLFDFTDLKKPKELDSYTIGDATSDSIAFNDLATLNYYYSDSKNLLAVPAVMRDGGNLNFAGVIVFSLVNNRLTLKGKIDHSYGGHFTNADSINGLTYYDNTVKRTIYSNNSDDLIYTLSNKLLKINKFADLNSVKDIILTSGSDDNIITSSNSSSSAGTPTQNSTSSPALDSLPPIFATSSPI